MNLCEAIQLMQMGRYLKRSEWPNITYVFLRGEEFRYSSLGIDSTWQPTNLDLLRNDWEEIIPER